MPTRDAHTDKDKRSISTGGRITRILLLLLIPLIFMGGVLWFSSKSGEESNSLSMKVTKYVIHELEANGHQHGNATTVNLIIRKLAHFTEYLLLTVILYSVIAAITRRPLIAACISPIIGIGFAVLDESSQLFVPGRTGSVFDVTIDTAGVMVGLVAILIMNVCRKLGG